MMCACMDTVLPVDDNDNYAGDPGQVPTQYRCICCGTLATPEELYAADPTFFSGL